MEPVPDAGESDDDNVVESPPSDPSNRDDPDDGDTEDMSTASGRPAGMGRCVRHAAGDEDCVTRPLSTKFSKRARAAAVSGALTPAPPADGAVAPPPSLYSCIKAADAMGEGASVVASPPGCGALPGCTTGDVLGSKLGWPPPLVDAAAAPPAGTRLTNRKPIPIFDDASGDSSGSAARSQGGTSGDGAPLRETPAAMTLGEVDRRWEPAAAQNGAVATFADAPGTLGDAVAALGDPSSSSSPTNGSRATRTCDARAVRKGEGDRRRGASPPPGPSTPAARPSCCSANTFICTGDTKGWSFPGAALADAPTTTPTTASSTPPLAACDTVRPLPGSRGAASREHTATGTRQAIKHTVTCVVQSRSGVPYMTSREERPALGAKADAVMATPLGFLWFAAAQAQGCESRSHPPLSVRPVRSRCRVVAGATAAVHNYLHGAARPADRQPQRLRRRRELHNCGVSSRFTLS